MQKPPTKMVEGFLNNSPKFNNSLLNQLFQFFSIKTVPLSQFIRFLIDKTHCFQWFLSSNIFASVTPTRSSSVTQASRLTLAFVS